MCYKTIHPTTHQNGMKFETSENIQRGCHPQKVMIRQLLRGNKKTRQISLQRMEDDNRINNLVK